MPPGAPRRVVRSPDVVWRLGRAEVLVRRIAVTDDAATLVGAGALVWVAAAETIDTLTLAADTGLSRQVTEATVDELLRRGWLVPEPSSPDRRPVGYRALGSDFVIHAPEPVAALLADAFCPLAAPQVDPSATRFGLWPDGDGWRLTEHGPEPAEDPAVIVRPLGTAVARLLERVNRLAAGALPEATVALHASTVVTPGPRPAVVTLVGASGAGKSTLGAAAALDGWGHLTEEIAAIDSRDRSVDPFHRPIGLRRGGAGALGLPYPDDDMFDVVWPWSPPPDRLVDTGTVACIALLNRHDRHVAPATMPMSPPQSLVELSEHNVVPDDARVKATFRSLERLVRTVPVVRLTYTTTHDALRVLLEVTGSAIVDPT